VPVGVLDHTDGGSAFALVAPALAVGWGANLVEKHFTLDRSLGGPDASFSLEPDELAELVRATRAAQAAVGRPVYGPTAEERDSLVFRRSLFVVADVAAGAELTPAHVRSIRPGFGLAPKHLPDVLGRRAARDLRRGTPLDWDMLA
jgi:N-acetylneuraminate synthase